MHILIIGAAGMVGRKLTERLAAEGSLGGRKIERATLVDVVAPKPPSAPFPIATDACDISSLYVPGKLVAGRPDVIFLLASIVSGEAEADFDKGYAINLDGTRHLFEAIRQQNLKAAGGYGPRVVFTSSVAVFGAPFHEEIS
ncbi:MAG: NAD-dependent epimerase/dehydratase family protein, partial [Methylobacteriaceae bacterium]|nr:NAD-dependent epimerase/dehydratase family protein [Methylobacteriaceae bacterium]